MKSTKKIVLILILSLIVVFTATSCGAKASKTLYQAETTTGSGCFAKTTESTFEWIETKITEGDTSAMVAGETDEEKLILQKENHINNLKNLINNYIVKSAVADSEKEEEINQNYIVAKINEDQNWYLACANNLTAENVTDNYEEIENWSTSINGGNTGCAGMFNVSLKKEIAQAKEKLVEDAKNSVFEETNVYKIAALYIIQANARLTELEPIVFKADNFGDFMSHLWNNLFIFPVGWLLFQVSNLLGGYYWIGLVIVTLLIRTLGWPIYAKSNDMTAKMNEMQPELTKIQEKYQGRQDQESQRMMQMEQAQLYKKYKVGIGGCLAPFLQFPIFVAVYRAVSRLPYTVSITGTRYIANWANELNPKFFGINLLEDVTGGEKGQIFGIIVLVVIVVGTQLLTQFLTKYFQKKNNVKKQENIPEYRRQAYEQQQGQQQQSMQLMMYMLVVMMGIFVWTSKAGLGLYWVVGNLFALVQMYINNTQKLKKIEVENNKKGLYEISSKEDKKKK